MQKPSIPKGTRDFSPEEMANRNYIFNTIKSVFQLYGFRQIETPAQENLSTLMGKYGEEGDKLLFKILNSGDYLDALDAKTRGLEKKELKELSLLDTEEYSAAINYVQECIKTYKSSSKIEEAYFSYFLDTSKQNIGKFIFNTYTGKKRKYDTLKKYITSEITPKKLRGFVKSALTQSRLSDLKSSSKLTTRISEKGLRYDLTVPFARYVVQHRDQITFPFKRYQIQPVWRADRPQKGRYREFYQCDADVVGSNSLVNEAELLQMIDEVFHRLSINVTIKLNNRKILAGIAEIIGQSDKIVDITVAIDKLDKIGLDNVNTELIEKGIPQDAIDRLQPVLLLQGSNAEKLNTLKTVLAASETGLKGVEELETIFDLVSLTQVATTIELDLTLARGLNYYTGAIIEVKANDVQIGSISGGGRYDNLTGVFGMDGVSGVGISFGADRIYDVLNQLNGFPAMSEENTRLLFINFGDKEQRFCLPLLKAVRAAGINAEIFPEAAKIKKQMSYADGKKIPFVAIVGENEMNANAVMLKNMTSGEQQLVPVDELTDKINAQ